MTGQPATRRPEGWFRLPKSGAVYYGPLPDGAEVLDGPPAVEDPAPPAPSAPKAAWVEYAVSQGWAPEDAMRKSKKALAAELGEQHIDAAEGGGPVGTEVPSVDLGADQAQGGLIPSGGGVLVGEQGPEVTSFEGDSNIVGHGDEA